MAKRSPVFTTLTKLSTTAWILIGALVCTGGIYGKFEISQVNVFGWIALLTGFWLKYKTGNFLPAPVLNLVQKYSGYLKPKHERTVLFYLFGGYVAFFTLAQVFRFHSFHSNAFDLSFSDQSIWASTYLRGRVPFLHSTIARGDTLLSEHFCPIFATFIPLYAINASVYWLFLGQSLLLGSGALFVYAIAKKIALTPREALFLATVYLFYPSIKSANLFDIKEDAFFIPLFFGAILAVLHSRWVWVWIAVLLSFTVKENAAIASFGLAVWIWARYSKPHGFILAIASVTAFFGVNLYVMPKFLPENSASVLTGRLSALGANSSEVLRNLFFGPLKSIALLLGEKVDLRTFKYAFQVLFPFTFFLRIKPLSNAIPFATASLLVMMNIFITNQTAGFHYEVILMPFAFLSLALGYKMRKSKFGSLNTAALLASLVFCVYGRSPALNLRQYWPNPEQRCLSQALKRVPKKFSVATLSALHPHLDQREDIEVFNSLQTTHADLIITSEIGGISLYANEDYRQELKKLDPEKYQSVFQTHVLSIWCRTDACEQTKLLVRELSSLGCLNRK